MPEYDDGNTREVGDVSVSVQHRCKRMADHGHPVNRPVPCSGCYSLRVTAEHLPWQPSEPRRRVVTGVERVPR